MREIKFEYGFESVNGIVKKVYALSEIPNISHKCDVWNILPIIYVRQYTGLKDKNGVEIYEGDIVEDEKTQYKVEYNTQKSSFCLVPLNIDILDFLNYQTLGNGYLIRRDLIVIENIHENK